MSDTLSRERLPDHYEDKILEWTRKLVSFKTYRRDGSTDDREFQQAIERALGWLENWAQQRGIRCYNWENRILELRLGRGDPVTGLAAHLDVVPPGEEPWDTGDPFDLTVEEREEMTVLHGRGVVDDKGPLASLMGVMDRFAGEEPENLPGTLCFIIDTAEEVGFGTAREYLDQHPDRIPDRSLVSDGYFPLVAGEKGLLWFDVEITPTECSDEGGRSPTLVELRAGSAYNQVPDSAHARLRIGEENHRRVREAFRRNHPSLTDRLREDYRDDGLLILEAEGESAHGAQPEDGKNALEVLLTYLGKIDWEHQNVELLFEKLQTMLDEQGTYRYDGSWIDLDDTDPRYDTGTTLNLGKMQYDSETGKITLSFDARLMPDQEIDVTLTKLRGILMDWLPDPWETSVKPVNREEALSINMENVLPTTALEAYRAVKEEPEAQPVYMGGRTHATAIPNCFAFGLMQFEHAHSYNFHGPHERVAWSELVEGAQIYYQTIRRLNGT